MSSIELQRGNSRTQCTTVESFSTQVGGANDSRLNSSPVVLFPTLLMVSVVFYAE